LRIWAMIFLSLYTLETLALDIPNFNNIDSLTLVIVKIEFALIIL
jgi:hypothetical protein